MDYYDEWYNALVADGWEHRPIYRKCEEDNKEVSTEFHRDGFTVHIYRKGDALSSGISAWGPDGLAIQLPEHYDFDATVAALKICLYCGEVGETQCIGFAGRVCAKCHEENVARVEYPGWNN